MRTKRGTHKESGAILVEMALMLPILALILVGVIDLGLIVREYQLLQNAAREGARFSSLPANQMAINANPAAVQTAIKQFVVDYALQENITINANNVTVNQAYVIPGGCGSEITVSYTRPVLLLGRPFFQIGSIVLRGRVVFHNLYGC